MPRSRLLVEERRHLIAERVDGQGRATVEELARRFRVSEVTIRLDLEALDRAGVLVRSHGGALRRSDAFIDLPLEVKEARRREEKRRIARAAASFVREGETILLDSGTTTAEVARQLKLLGLKSLTVITNALNVAIELANRAEVRLVMLGGMVRPLSYSLVGPHAEQTLRGLNADRLFLGVDGLDPEIGLTTPDVLEAQLNALMIRAAREVTVVADATKLGRRSLSVIAPVESVHRVITDDGAPPEILAALRARGVEVITAARDTAPLAASHAAP